MQPILAKRNRVSKSFIITIPKSGTYLFVKYFKTLLQKQIIQHKNWHTTHFYELNFNKHFREYKYQGIKSIRKPICLIRDPRDIICSLVDWLERKKNYAYTDITFKPKWYKLSRSEKIQCLINTSATQKQLSDIMKYNCNGMTLAQKIKESAERAVLFKSIPHILLIRFEDIIGRKGKGDLFKQKETFQKVNAYLNITIDENTLTHILNSLWGPSETIPQPTFYKGYIGRWKEEFDEQAIIYMKMYYSNILKKLEYETDNQWDI